MIYNILNRSKGNILPKASEVLEACLRQQNYPFWTAYFVKYKTIVNDQFFKSCFCVNIDGKYDYFVLRTGCFPFVKYHCTRLTRPNEIDQALVKYENRFFNFIKLINLGRCLTTSSPFWLNGKQNACFDFDPQGLPTIAYGVGGLLLATHVEVVKTSKADVKIYFWYKEDKTSPYWE